MPVGLTSYVPNARVFGIPNKQGNRSVWALVWDNASGKSNMATMSDGTSNTLLITEKPMITGDAVVALNAWGITGQTEPRLGGANLMGTTDAPPELHAFFGTNCNDPSQTWDDEDGQWWAEHCRFDYNGTPREFFQPPRPKRPRIQQLVWNLYPIHTGGQLNGVFGDDSVRSVSNNIDVFVWSAIVTPNGGEVESIQ